MDVKEKIYNYLIQYKKENAYPPSVREICAYMNFSSTSTAKYYLDKLEKEGKITKSPYKNRAIDIIEEHSLENETVSLPVIGTIAAGIPITAFENRLDNITLSSHLFRGNELFVLKVKGESMINCGIFDGDYVVISKQETARNGEIVAAMIDGEATVKRFYKENNMFRLQPENNFMEPIFTRELTILGKVVGLLRTNI